MSLKVKDKSQEELIAIANKNLKNIDLNESMSPKSSSPVETS